VSSYMLSALVVGFPSLGSCIVGVVALMRAKREDIPAVVRALNRRARRTKRPKGIHIVPYPLASPDQDQWVATRRDTHDALTAESADELREKIRADYHARPVPR